jgi:hypothetical protein
MKAVVNPTWVLRQRQEFLGGMEEIVRLCNWSEKDIQDLKDYLWDDVVRIDNILYTVFEETNDHRLAYIKWEEEMEDLRRWLSLITGIKIKYI